MRVDGGLQTRSRPPQIAHSFFRLVSLLALVSEQVEAGNFDESQLESMKTEFLARMQK